MGGKLKKTPIILGVFIAVLFINEFVRPASFKFQPYLPGVVETRSWLQINCRGKKRDIDKCKATIAALEGSGAEALKLASSITPDDLSGRHYWLHIAAQNGSAEGMRLLAQALADLPDGRYGRVHRIRAHFWLERAIQAGDAEAKSLLPNILSASEPEMAAHRIPNAANPNLELVCGPMPWWRIFAALWGDLDYRLSTNADANLPCEVVAELEMNALRGESTSSDSALNIVRQIRLIQPRSRQANDLDIFHWNTIAAENGGSGSGEVLSTFLYTEPRIVPDMKIRARFWLKKDIESGDNTFAKYLAKLQLEDMTTEWFNIEP